MKDYTLGQKIKMYRERADMSQMDLELEIGASPGSISRIENGKTNPTKETILHISKAVGLSNVEATDLLSINTDSLVELLKVLTVSNVEGPIELHIEEKLTRIAQLLNYITIVLLVITDEGKLLSPGFISNTWTAKKAIELIGGPLNKHKMVMSENKENAFVRSITEGKTIAIESVREIAKGFIPQGLADITQKFSKQKKAFTVPLIYHGEKLGCIYWGKYNQDNYYNEVELIETIAKHFAELVFRNKESIKEYYS